MTCQVQQLSECVQHLEAVANWIFYQWWSRRCDSVEAVLAWLRTHTQKDKVPYTVVALVEGIPVGSCSVIQNDCVHRPQYSPWLAAVFVKPEMRLRGIASAMLQEAAAIAGRADVKVEQVIDVMLRFVNFFESRTERFRLTHTKDTIEHVPKVDFGGGDHCNHRLLLQ